MLTAITLVVAFPLPGAMVITERRCVGQLTVDRSTAKGMLSVRCWPPVETFSFVIAAHGEVVQWPSGGLHGPSAHRFGPASQWQRICTYAETLLRKRQ